MLYASVRIINLPYSADKSYEYQIPLQLEDKVRAGSIVLVPFGTSNKVQTALVTEVSDKKAYSKVKPILSAPGKYLFVKKELLELCMYMSEKMLCSVGDAVKCVLPAGLGVQKSKIYEAKKKDEYIIPDEIQKSAAMKVLNFIESAGKVSGVEIENEFGTVATASLKRLEKIGALSVFEDYVCKISAKKEKFVRINTDKSVIEAIKNREIKLTPKQADAYEILMQSDTEMSLSELMELSGINSMSVIRELAIKGALILYEIDKDRSASVLTEFADGEYGDFTLSEEQQSAYEKLYNLYLSNEPKAALLHGVTGSGKTNVILKLIDKVIESGKNVIVLVPEIALTSQTVGRFAARYKKDGIALIHSALSVGERIDAYKKINSGEARIIIGTRSAVFAPTENIGLIVMDEEHESSFKSDKSPKYHARDIARFRCVYGNALLVMASATPSVESYYRAKSGRYELVELKNRYGTKLPEVEFYDMKDEPYFEMPEDKFDPFEVNLFEDIFETPGVAQKGNGESLNEGALPVVIGKKLEEEIANCIEKKEQAILFINRRGYRAFALCRSCGNVFTCPNCSVSMTYHKLKREKTGKMVCHYCGYSERVPDTCTKCGKPRISFVGSGTQLIEETLKRKFPDARVLRMDADTTGGKFAHEKILTEFRNGNADILVGTQMVAKGHDFPKVSLVGVALADTSLIVNDFRANEKTFSLLTQVLGRSGRVEHSGKAILQTYVPDNNVLNLAAKQDYTSFYDLEIAFRKSNVFPPFCDIVTIDFSSLVESDLINAVKIFGKELDEAARKDYNDVKFILYGPMKNEIYRIAGKYRMRYIMKCRNTKRTREMLSQLLKKYSAAFKNVTMSTDINPTNL